LITWEEALASELELAPGLADFKSDSNPPVMPDGNGNYPIVKPGQTKVL
jgi:hypothetical protein